MNIDNNNSSNNSTENKWGLAAPLIGGFADKYQAHRFAQVGGGY